MMMLSAFQVIMIIFSLIGFAASIITLYVKNSNEVTKINARLSEHRNLIDMNAKSVETIRQENRADHKLMFQKMDTLISKV